jgi:hypothetical protein
VKIFAVLGMMIFLQAAPFAVFDVAASEMPHAGFAHCDDAREDSRDSKIRNIEISLVSVGTVLLAFSVFIREKFGFEKCRWFFYAHWVSLCLAVSSAVPLVIGAGSILFFLIFPVLLSLSLNFIKILSENRFVFYSSALVNVGIYSFAALILCIQE